jgi:hypothetical protein
MGQDDSRQKRKIRNLEKKNERNQGPQPGTEDHFGNDSSQIAPTSYWQEPYSIVEDYELK